MADIAANHSKCILVVSDLHSGSIYGMLPPDFATQDGAPKIPNAGHTQRSTRSPTTRPPTNSLGWRGRAV